MRALDWIIQSLDRIITNERCQICKKSGLRICKGCLVYIKPPEHDLPEYIFALYEYRDPYIKQILTDAKYRNKFAGLKAFDRVMHDAMLDIISEYVELNNYSNIILLPVPISNKRLRARGYNQAEIIANSIYKISTGIILGNKIIKKIKDRTPQASIHSRKERLRSPVGTFEVINKEMIQDSLCIIIDDITTTGGTINEMRRILIESGARDAFGLSIAH